MMVGGIGYIQTQYGQYYSGAVNAVSAVRRLPNDVTLSPGGRVQSSGECQTCKNRKYVDGSNDMGVSFKTPGHISPESAGATVRAHEQEHVSAARAKGSKANAELVSANVRIQTSVCPECGRTYVSGGVTTTSIKYSNDNSPYTDFLKAMDATVLPGMSFDARR